MSITVRMDHGASTLPVTFEDSTLSPEGAGCCRLLVPRALDQPIGPDGPLLSTVTSGWEHPRCRCHNLTTEPASVTLVCRLAWTDVDLDDARQAVHVVESRHCIYGDAVTAKHHATRTEPGPIRVLRTAYACGHTT